MNVLTKGKLSVQFFTNVQFTNYSLSLGSLFIQHLYNVPDHFKNVSISVTAEKKNLHKTEKVCTKTKEKYLISTYQQNVGPERDKQKSE